MAPKTSDLEESLIPVNEGSPLLDREKQAALSEFKKRRISFFSFTEEDEALDLWDRPVWRLTHAGGFLIGGFFFLIGTLLYYPAMWFSYEQDEDIVGDLGVWTAWLYIIGSCGFLYVDVQEFFTFVDEPILRLNIFCSAFGSTLYVIGSAGFLPSWFAFNPLIGILGFIGGSAAIGTSQAWKLYRILTTSERPYSIPTINAACVEGGAMVGGYCFLIGTFVFWHGPIEGDVGCEVTCGPYNTVLVLWVLGSLMFSFGGVSLAYRHAVLKMT